MMLRLMVIIQFLLTRPSRGVTLLARLSRCFQEFLLTRPSRGVTQPVLRDGVLMNDFYSHAPRGA